MIVWLFRDCASTNVADRNAQIGATNTFFQCNTLTGGEDSVKNTRRLAR